METEANQRQTAIGLFRLLREFSIIRRKAVVDIEEYESHFWLHTLPTRLDSFNRLFADDQEIDSDIWVEIRRREEPQCPRPPTECLPWLKSEYPFDNQNPPTIRDKRLVEQVPQIHSSPDEAEEVGETVRWESLDGYPEVAARWETFLKSEWIPWAQEHSEWTRHHRLYSHLFGIRQTLKRAGEQFEFVLAFGFLETKTSEGKRVRRHVITQRATLDFGLEDGTITVRAPTGGGHPGFEVDMLSVDQRPPEEVIVRFEQKTAPSLEEDPWNRAIIEDHLRAFANSYPHGIFLADNFPADESPYEFRVTYAPALILRKRSLRGMLTTFDSVIKQLEDEGPVPPSIRVIAGDRRYDDAKTDRGGKNPTEVPERIYFPKPVNREQLEIVHRMESSDGLLVQGPPGTGKSHTIANLICHLLATEQRVLVTAETPRALRVLAAKIPEQIRPLCVSLLGNDRESYAGLEASVKGIAQALATWDQGATNKKVERLEKRYDKVRGEREEIDARLRTLREAETQIHEVASGEYAGTAQSIAEQVARDRQGFDWIDDDVDFLAAPPLSTEEFAILIRLLREFDDERLAELELGIPDPQKLLPSTQALIDLIEKERKAVRALASFDGVSLSSQLSALERAPADQVQRLAVRVEELHQAYETAKRRPLPWIATAVHGVLADHVTPWRTLREVTATDLDTVAVRARRADKRRVKLPADVEPVKVLADATDVLRVLNTGRPLNVFTKITNGQLRRARYLFRGTTVDGRQCDSRDRLLALVEYLQVSKTLEDIWRQWADFTDSKPTTLTAQVARLEENVEALDQVIDLHRTLERTREQVKAIEGLPEPAWHDEDERESLRKACARRLAVKDLETAKGKLQEIEGAIANFMATCKSHPIVQRIRDAIRIRDDDAIVEARLGLTELSQARERADERKTILAKFSAVAPKLEALLLETANDSVWDVRVDQFASAWRWAQARSWLKAVRDDEGFNKLNDRHVRLRSETETALEELASARAWKNTLNRMTEGHRQHLVGWQQVMKRGGKFTGKYAATYRKQAQQHLEKCREAIPAWVMPLFQLYETVRPQPGMFDVVIVDEASQCGLDALVLMYIGKKVIIVGDDEQISPTAIGIRGDKFQTMVDHFLPGFEHADAFHAETSLFALGDRWFPNRVVLREHFRCMPEIIRFSNDLCYRSTPLIPLRQYAVDRLEPVQSRFIADGAQRGKASKIINEAEAQAVADAVVNCCNDPKYEGKEMGVISMVGEAQARRIESLLLGQLQPEEIEKRRIVCGDAYSFQGDERDVMLLSLVNAVTDESGVSTRSPARVASRYKQRYNVAASRARDQLCLFHSLALDDLPNPEDLRRALVEFCVHGGEPTPTVGDLDIEDIRRLAHERTGGESPPRPFDSWFEVDVFLRIHDAGYYVIPQFEFAGYYIDLVVESGSQRLAVECDGDQWHGPAQYQKDLDRQRQLERAEWTFWRLRGSEFYSDPETAMDGLWAVLNRLGIQTRYQKTEQTPEPEPSASERGADPTLASVETTRIPPPPPPRPPESPRLLGPEDDADQTGLRFPHTSPEDTSLSTEDDQIIELVEPNEENLRSVESDLKVEQSVMPVDEAGESEDRRGGVQDRSLDSSLPDDSLLGSDHYQGPVRVTAPESPVELAFETGLPATPTRPDDSKQIVPSTKHGLPAYEVFVGAEIPDPHSGEDSAVLSGLLEIVRVEGPIIQEVLVRRYTYAAGLRRAGRLIKKRLGDLIAKAKRRGDLVIDYQHAAPKKQVPVIRRPDQNFDAARQLGGRHLHEVPPTEIAVVMRRIMESNRVHRVSNRKAFFRLVLEQYGLKRLTTQTERYLDTVLDFYIEDKSRN